MALVTLDDATAPALANTKSREAQVLSLCARPRPCEEEKLASLLAEGIDWPYLLLAGHRQGMLPLLYSRLQVFGNDPVPDQIREQLARFHESNRRRSLACREEIQASLGHLASAGIEAVALRQPSLMDYYDDPVDREVEPIEVLVAPSDAGRARDILLARGYRRVHPLSPAQEAALLQSRPLPLHNDECGVRLHLYSRALPQFIERGALDTVLRARFPRRAEGGVARTRLRAEELLIHTCLHGSFNMWGKLLWLTDVAAILERESDLDWPALLACARESGLLRLVLLGLLLAKDLLDAPLPQAVEELARGDEQLARIAQRLQEGYWRDLRGRTSEAERLRFRMSLMTSRRERIRFCARFALTPAVEDLRAVRLPPVLMSAYSFIRPARLAVHITKRVLGRVRAPYFSTPMPLVEHMLAMAGVGPDDVVYDLGCGDGRAVITAAKLYGARGVGIDLVPQRIAESRANAREAGVERLVRFEQGDATKADLSEATVVFLWLLPALNLYMRPSLQAELKPGARIVSHAFDMGDWLPDRTDLVALDDGQVSVAYLWSIAGHNTASAPDAADESGPPVFVRKVGLGK